MNTTLIISAICIFAILPMLAACLVIANRTSPHTQMRQAVVVAGVFVFAVLFSAGARTYLAEPYTVLVDVSMLIVTIAMMIFVLANISLSEIS